MQIEAVSDDATASGSAFTFHALDNAFACLSTPQASEQLTRWGLAGEHAATQAAAFRFDGTFKPEMADAFLLDFLNSDVVQAAAPVSAGRGAWTKLGPVTAVQSERLATNVLRLDFFDRLEAAEVVRGGHISKCFDAQVGEVLASDRLRLALLDEAAEEWELFSAQDRRELIFHLFRTLCVGGGLCQFEDLAEPYLARTKELYKECVGVSKNSAGALQVHSLAFRLHGVTAAAPLFPRESDHNFCFVTVDPVARRVKLWYGSYLPLF